jgi:two-component system, OmpR family, response regulator
MPVSLADLSRTFQIDMRLLLVEDDEPLAAGLAGSLRLGGYAVDAVARGSHASAALAVENYDAVILDLNLPDTDGLSLLRQWRNQGLRMPVLILSARDEIDDRVKGLDLGADDYLVKPFDVSELEARLRVLIRRMQGGLVDNRIELGPLTLDISARRAQLHGQDLPLTGREFALLQMLAMRAGQVLPKEQLISRLSDFEQDMSANALDILIHRLRKKLEGSSLGIRTLRGLGYLLENSA